MGKRVYIAEKPSVAREFAKALRLREERGRDGFLEQQDVIVTWCVGHLVTMSYPEAYDGKLKTWRYDTLPFLPEVFQYEVIPEVKKQFQTVKTLLTRDDVTEIYVCTDSGREGEYIYRLVEQMSGVSGKIRKRVWIDSQTEEEILRGIREAKDLSEYDNLAASAYLRAKEDYLIGINFSRILTLKYGKCLASLLHRERVVISVGRVMTCVLGMIVRREREIRSFVKTPFYRVIAGISLKGQGFEAEWRVSETSRYVGHPFLYKENGWREKIYAQEVIDALKTNQPLTATVESKTKKTEKKAPPLLYNLAELQNDCSRRFKISPDATLKIAQELYEKKLITYPRTDARVLSTPAAKEIEKNIRGLTKYQPAKEFSDEILSLGSWKNIGKTKYVNDKQITDHYAIIPTGQGFGAYGSLSAMARNVYDLIVRRFLSIFYPPAVYDKISLILGMEHRDGDRTYTEQFTASFKTLIDPGYLKVVSLTPAAQTVPGSDEKEDTAKTVGAQEETERGEKENKCSLQLLEALSHLRKGSRCDVMGLWVKEGETSPPARYNSGSMILAMENAGQLIEDEELRAQIKGSGIGTSATRAEILQKLIRNQFILLNAKTQILAPTLFGEMIYQVVFRSMKAMLNPEMTASWEKGLSYVAEGTLTPDSYMEKLNSFVSRRVLAVKQLQNERLLEEDYREIYPCYQHQKKRKKS